MERIAMRNIVTLFCTIVALVIGGAAWAYNKAKNDKALPGVQVSIPFNVKVRQLPLDESSKLIPVEIIKATASTNGKNVMDHFSCVVRNNTDKGINAIAVAITVVLDNGGIEHRTTAVTTSDNLVHPDIREERRMKDIESGSTIDMNLPGPSTFKEGDFVKDVIVEVRCAMFADDTSVGNDPRGETATRIRQSRVGAANYKEWLKQQDSQGRGGIDKLIEIANSQEMPESLRDRNLKEGANTYRRWLLGLHKDKGDDAVSTYLKKRQ
jgi:hypothetical protein